MNLLSAKLGVEYTVEAVNVDDEELVAFLFSLGCFAGETITVVSRHGYNMVLAIKDGRYSVDKNLAGAISIK